MIVTHPTAVLQQIRADIAPRIRAHRARGRRRAWLRGLASAFDGLAVLMAVVAALWVGAAVLIAWAVDNSDGRLGAALTASHFSTVVVWLCGLFYAALLLVVLLGALWTLVHWMDDEPQGRVISRGRAVTRVDP